MRFIFLIPSILREISRKLDLIMATLADLDSKLSELSTDIANFKTNATAALAALQAKLDAALAAGTPVDTTAEIATVQGLIDSVAPAIAPAPAAPTDPNATVAAPAGGAN